MAATKESGYQGIGRGYRYYSSVTCTSAALGAGGTAIDMQGMAGGSISASSTNANTAFTAYASLATSTGPFRALYDEDAVAVTMTVAASRCTQLPAAVYGVRWLVLQAGTASAPSVYLKG